MPTTPSEQSPPAPSLNPAEHPEGSLAIAAPSWVLPETPAANIRFLNGKVDEVALCLFQTQECLAYTDDDLPPALADLPLTFHVHLPMDLPWSGEHPAPGMAAKAADVALEVFAKAAPLSPRMAVLHPPAGPVEEKRRLLSAFAASWFQRSSVPLLLENIAHCNVVELGNDFRCGEGFGLCLDIAHLMGYGQRQLLASSLPEAADLVHWSAPGKQDEHLPLTSLTPDQRNLAATLLRRIPASAMHLLEIFSWDGVKASIPCLRALARTVPSSTLI